MGGLGVQPQGGALTHRASHSHPDGQSRAATRGARLVRCPGTHSSGSSACTLARPPAAREASPALNLAAPDVCSPPRRARSALPTCRLRSAIHSPRSSVAATPTPQDSPGPGGTPGHLLPEPPFVLHPPRTVPHPPLTRVARVPAVRGSPLPHPTNTAAPPSCAMRSAARARPEPGAQQKEGASAAGGTRRAAAGGARHSHSRPASRVARPISACRRSRALRGTRSLAWRSPPN